MNFRETTLGEISGGGSYGLGASSSTDSSGPKFLRTTDIVSGTIDWSDVPYCSADSETIAKYKLFPEDIVISRTGANAGLNCLVLEPPDNAIFAGYLVRFQINRELADARYVSYLLRSSAWKEFVEVTRTGSAQPQFNAVLMSQFPIALPSLNIQKAISALLSVLDARIAANNALSKTLEDIAQTIFKSWFIDFDPVKAKMSGEKPAGMDAATAALFPDSMDESELGLIPNGWQVKLLGDLVMPRKGKTITRATCVEGDVPVVAGGLQPAYFHNTANVIQPAITVSASGANAGYVRLYLEDIWASDCSYINPEITQTVFFWFLFLSRNQELIYGMQQGAAQPHIYPSDLMRLKLSYPKSIDSVLKFEETVAPLFLEIGALKRQNESLRSLRDSLLPRLISGALQIPEEMLVS